MPLVLFLVGLAGSILIGGWRYAETGVFYRFDIALGLVWFILWNVLAVRPKRGGKSGGN